MTLQTFRLSKELTKDLDDLVRKRRYESRAAVIRCAIKDLLILEQIVSRPYTTQTTYQYVVIEEGD